MGCLMKCVWICCWNIHGWKTWVLYKEAKKQGLFDYFLFGTYNIYQGCGKGLCGISKGDIFFGFFFASHIISLFLFERVKGGGKLKPGKCGNLHIRMALYH